MISKVPKNAIKAIVAGMFAVSALADSPGTGMALSIALPQHADPTSASSNGAVGHRDKTGTSRDPENEHGSQSVEVQHLTSRCSFEAEDMGFEPTTHCWASDFESDRWPIRLSSGIRLTILQTSWDQDKLGSSRFAESS